MEPSINNSDETSTPAESAQSHGHIWKKDYRIGKIRNGKITCVTHASYTKAQATAATANSVWSAIPQATIDALPRKPRQVSTPQRLGHIVLEIRDTDLSRRWPNAFSREDIPVPKNRKLKVWIAVLNGEVIRTGSECCIGRLRECLADGGLEVLTYCAELTIPEHSTLPVPAQP